MIRCLHCGQMIPEDAPWCVKCGAPRPDAPKASTPPRIPAVRTKPRGWLADLPPYDPSMFVHRVTEERHEIYPGCTSHIEVPQCDILWRAMLLTVEVMGSEDLIHQESVKPTRLRLIVSNGVVLVWLTDATMEWPFVYDARIDTAYVCGLRWELEWPQHMPRTDLAIAYEWMTPMVARQGR